VKSLIKCQAEDRFSSTISEWNVFIGSPTEWGHRQKWYSELSDYNICIVQLLEWLKLSKIFKLW